MGFLPEPHVEIFKKLTPEEEKKFRQWARDNFDPENLAEFIEKAPLYHPVVRDECKKILKKWKEDTHVDQTETH